MRNGEQSGTACKFVAIRAAFQIAIAFAHDHNALISLRKSDEQSVHVTPAATGRERPEDAELAERYKSLSCR